MQTDMSEAEAIINLAKIKKILTKGKLFVSVKNELIGEKGLIACSNLRRVVLIDPHDPNFCYYALGIIFDDDVRGYVYRRYATDEFPSLEELAKVWKLIE